MVELDPPVERYVLKSMPNDPVRRMDLTLLPRPTRTETEAFVRDLTGLMRDEPCFRDG